jgi:hypothetical protein
MGHLAMYRGWSSFCEQIQLQQLPEYGRGPLGNFSILVSMKKFSAVDIYQLAGYKTRLSGCEEKQWAN